MNYKEKVSFICTRLLKSYSLGETTKKTNAWYCTFVKSIN